MRTGELEKQTPKQRPRLVLFGYELALWRAAVVLLAVMLAAGIALTPAPQGVAQKAMVALGLISMTVVLWATLAIPPPLAAAIFIGLVIVTGAAAPASAISGFLSSSLWLVFGGLMIGAAAERTGFGRFIARRFLGRFRSSFSALVLGVIAGSTLLTFLVPSNIGRLAITIPVVLALAPTAMSASC